MDIDTRIIYGC